MVESQSSMWQRWRSRLRRLSVVLILGVLIVVMLQNWPDVEFHLFFTTVKMPGTVMLFAFAGAGFIAGALWGWWRR